MGGQDKKRLGFYYSDLTADFFRDVVEKIHPGAKFIKWVETSLEPDSSDADATIDGFKPLRVYYEYCSADGSNVKAMKELMLKVRRDSKAIHNDFAEVYTFLDKALGDETQRVFGTVVMKDITLRDLYCLSETAPAWRAILPTVYKIVCDIDRHRYAYVVDNYLAPENRYTHLDVTDKPEVWTREDVLDLFKQMANFHALYYGRLDKLPSNLAEVVDPTPTIEMYNRFKPFAQRNYEVCLDKFPHHYPPEIRAIFGNALRNADNISGILQKGPHTLVHNDFSIRNICKRENPAPGQSRMCVYDWELAIRFPPQLDIVHFLFMWLPADVTIDTWYEYLDMYRKYLIDAMEAQDEAMTQEVKDALEKDAFMQMSDMCFLHLFVTYYQMYVAFSILVEFPFLERAISVRNTIVKHLKVKYHFL